MRDTAAGRFVGAGVVCFVVTSYVGQTCFCYSLGLLVLGGKEGM